MASDNPMALRAPAAAKLRLWLGAAALGAPVVGDADGVHLPVAHPQRTHPLGDQHLLYVDVDRRRRMCSPMTWGSTAVLMVDSITSARLRLPTFAVYPYRGEYRPD